MPNARKRPRPIQIVATPGSGNGRALHNALHLRQALEVRGHPTELDVFSTLDDLHHWATTGRRPFSCLICVGGDGTLDTAAVAAERRSVPFLALTSGFGNLFGRALGQPQRVDRAIDILEAGEIVHADVGVRNRRVFLCHESYGLLSDIQSRVESGTVTPRVRWRRHLAYYQMALRHLRETPLTDLRVTVDDRTVATDAVVVTVANVEAYGPWLPLTPEASPVDGLLDVFIMRRTSKRELLARLLKRQLRLPGKDPHAVICRGRRVSVTAPRKVRDTLRVLPRRLPVLVPRATAEALARGRTRAGSVSGARARQVA
jgi:diacylglycerol kinase family enzyme